MKLLLGTGNPAKLARLRWIAEGLDFEVTTSQDLGPEPSTQEGDRSARENAELKAIAWATGYRVATLASDGGLVVPALGERWNSTRTRRAAGEHASDAGRAEHLLELMRGLHGDERLAYRMEAGAIARADGSLVGSWVGLGTQRRIAEAYDPRGVPTGFWLPGLFLFEPGNRRYGDLSPQERVAVDDHWVTLRAMVREALESLLRQAQEQARGAV